MVLGVSAAAAAVGAHELFSYNRENYLFDRKMRQETEFQILEWRSAQAELWRDDVREIVGLTEKKMDNYLIVGTLQLGMCLALFSEGRLEPGTPPWLLHFYMLTLGGAFMYLLMSVWLAMHASIVASCSSVKLLTQFVRLPVPTWRQLEEMRTYAETYEAVEPKRMLRIPFTGGSPQKSAGSAAASLSGSASGSPAASSRNGGALTSDPWDKELHGAFRDLEELQAKPAALRGHIGLARKAAVQYQCFDAFARVAMSFGTNQLLSAISYYILGYVAVQDGAPWPAWTMVAIMMSISIGMLSLDFSLSRREQSAAWTLAVSGPLCSSAAVGLWTMRGREVDALVLPLLACAYASHGLWLFFAVNVCGLQTQPCGAVLPTKFRSVLYLDVFGWWSTDDGEGTSSAPPIMGEATGDQPRPVRVGAAAADGSSRPPVMLPPEAFAVPRQVGSDHERHFEAEQFAGNSQPLRAARRRRGGSEEEIVTGHDKLRPGKAPAKVFQAGTMILALLWAVSLALPFGVFGNFMTKPLTAKVFVEEIEENTPGEQPHIETREVEAVVGTQPDGLPELMPELPIDRPGSPELPEGSLIDVAWPMHSGFVPRSLSCDPDGKQLVVADDLGVFWGSLTTQQPAEEPSEKSGAPRANGSLVSPRRRLEGSADGKPAHRHARTRVSFSRAAPCKALEGQALKDVSVVCPQSGQGACRVAVLHAGRRLVECPLEGPPAGSESGLRMLLRQQDRPVWQISGEWLHWDSGKSESLESVAVDSECLKGGTPPASPRMLSDGSTPLVVPDYFQPDKPGCVVVGTSSGRIVQLRSSSTGERRLVPERAVQRQVQTVARGSLHVFANGLFMALRHETGSIEAFDSDKGTAVAEWRLPKGVQWLMLCAGGDSIFALGLRNATRVELHRFPLPELLKAPVSDSLPKEHRAWHLGPPLRSGAAVIAGSAAGGARLRV